MSRDFPICALNCLDFREIRSPLGILPTESNLHTMSCIWTWSRLYIFTHSHLSGAAAFWTAHRNWCQQKTREAESNEAARHCHQQMDNYCDANKSQ